MKIKSKIKNTYQILVVSLLILSITQTAWGGEYSSFNLTISNSEFIRINQNQALKTRVSSITAYRSEKISTNLGGSLIFGYQEQFQDKNTIVAARYATGYFAGIRINYDLLRTLNYRINVFTGFQYHQLEGSEGKQKITISWYDITLGIGNYYNITTRLKLLADVSFFQEKGSQRALEPLSQTINFKNKSNISYSVGMAYHLNASGYIAVKWLDGYQQGFQLFFAKDF